MPCDPNTLLHEARCFTCLTEEQLAIINLSLLCQIASGGGDELLFLETFEAPGGYDLPDWVEEDSGGASNIIDPDYTGVVLQGLQSIRITDGDLAQTYIERTIDPISHIFFFFEFQLISTGGADIFAILSAIRSDTFPAVTVVVDTSAMQFILDIGGVSVTITDPIISGVKYNCWLDYNANNGANRFASFGFSSGTTRPISGSNYGEVTGAVSALDVVSVKVGISESDFAAVHDFVMDYIMGSATQIGDNPTGGTPVQPLSPVAVDWVSNVIANGGTPPATNTVEALSDFMYALDAAGLTSKMIAVNCLVPDSLIACITPLIVGPGFNPWTNSGFLASALTVNGLIGNNSNLLATGTLPTRDFTSDADCGITLYNMTATNEVARDAGGGNCVAHIGLGGNMFWDCWVNPPDQLTTANSLWTGYISFNRHGVNTQVVYRAKSSVPHAVLATRNGLGSVRAAIALMVFGNGGGFSCAKRFSFAAIHHGLTTAESNSFFNCIQAMRTALGGGFL